MSFPSDDFLVKALNGDRMAAASYYVQQFALAIKQLKGKELKAHCEGLKQLVQQNIITAHVAAKTLSRLVLFHQAISNVPPGIVIAAKDPLMELQNIEDFIEKKMYQIAFSRLEQLNGFRSAIELQPSQLLRFTHINMHINGELYLVNLPSDADPIVGYFSWIKRDEHFIDTDARVFADRDFHPQIFDLLLNEPTSRRYPLWRYLIPFQVYRDPKLIELCKKAREEKVAMDATSNNLPYDLKNLADDHQVAKLCRNFQVAPYNPPARTARVCARLDARLLFSEAYPSLSEEFKSVLIPEIFNLVEQGLPVNLFSEECEFRKECIHREIKLKSLPNDPYLVLDQLVRLQNILRYSDKILARTPVLISELIPNFTTVLLTHVLEQHYLPGDVVKLDRWLLELKSNSKETAEVARIFLNLPERIDAKTIEDVVELLPLIPDEEKKMVLDKLLKLAILAQDEFLATYVSLLHRRYKVEPSERAKEHEKGLQRPAGVLNCYGYLNHMMFDLIPLPSSALLSQDNLITVMAQDLFKAHFVKKGAILQGLLMKGVSFKKKIPLNAVTHNSIFELCYIQATIATFEVEGKWIVQIPKGHARYGQALVRKIEILAYQYKDKYDPKLLWDYLQPSIHRILKFKADLELDDAEFASKDDTDTINALKKFDDLYSKWKMEAANAK